MLEYMLKMNKIMHAETEKELKNEVSTLIDQNKTLKRRHTNSESELGRLRTDYSQLNSSMDEMSKWLKMYNFENER